MEEDLEVLEKELANIRNLIEYYTFESLDYDKKFRMERFEKAIENLINRNKELEEIKQQKLDKYLYKNQWICKDLAENYIHKSKIREKIEERFGILCMQLGSYERDNATPEQERIAGGINELRKLKKELLEERN